LTAGAVHRPSSMLVDLGPSPPHHPGMDRRRFLLTSLAGVSAAPLGAEAQSPPVRIGLLGPAEEPRFSEIVSGLKQGLREQGYREETIHIVEGRTQRGVEPEARTTVDALARERVAVLFVVGSALVRLAREAAPHLPIVFVTPGDPVAAGLVASLARPGGNVTAMTFEYPELSGKRLELLREVAPHVRRVLTLYDLRDASPRQGAAAARAAATALGITLIEREVRNAADISRGLKALDEADALLGIPGGATSGHHETMIATANSKRLPTVFYTRTRSTHDALLTYGASDVDIAREAARMIDKILKGANAGDLPVERPIRLSFVINLKTAKALGLTIPPSLLLRADQAIE
jgi:putative tryptophan/tyrosine transport system substrate-binding protein